MSNSVMIDNTGQNIIKILNDKNSSSPGSFYLLQNEVADNKQKINERIKYSEINIPNGVARLNENRKIPMELVDDALLGNVNYQGTWDAHNNIPDLTNILPKGHYYIATTGVSNRFGHSWEVGDWIISNGTSWNKVDNTDAVSSVCGRTGAVTLYKSDVGLSSVDNTSDLDKPVSTAMQAELDKKSTIYYGVCTTSANANTKEAIVSPDFFSLEPGIIVHIYFSYTNTASGTVTLNVNNTGAKTIAGASYTTIGAGLNICVYDGTYWQVTSKSIAPARFDDASNTFYRGIVALSGGEFGERALSMNTVTIAGTLLDNTRFAYDGVYKILWQIQSGTPNVPEGVERTNQDCILITRSYSSGNLSDCYQELHILNLQKSFYRFNDYVSGTGLIFSAWKPMNAPATNTSHGTVITANNTAITDQSSVVPYHYIASAGDVDLNSYRTIGIWTFYNVSSATNFPSGTWTSSANTSILQVQRFYSNTAVRQLLHKRGTNEMWIRYSTSATAWGDWERIITDKEIKKLPQLQHVYNCVSTTEEDINTINNIVNDFFDNSTDMTMSIKIVGKITLVGSLYFRFYSQNIRNAVCFIDFSDCNFEGMVDGDGALLNVNGNARVHVTGLTYNGGSCFIDVNSSYCTFTNCKHFNEYEYAIGVSIRCKGSYNSFLNITADTQDSFINVSYAKNCNFINCHGKTGVGGFSIMGSENCHFENCSFDRVYWQIWGDDYTTYVNNCRQITFNNCYMAGENESSGIIYSSANYKLTFSNCTIKNISTESTNRGCMAISLAGGRYIVFDSCEIIGYDYRVPIISISGSVDSTKFKDCDIHVWTFNGGTAVKIEPGTSGFITFDTCRIIDAGYSLEVQSASTNLSIRVIGCRMVGEQTHACIYQSSPQSTIKWHVENNVFNAYSCNNVLYLNGNGFSTSNSEEISDYVYLPAFANELNELI